MEKFIGSKKRFCISNVLYYEREEHFLSSLCGLSQGGTILGNKLRYFFDYPNHLFSRNILNDSCLFLGVVGFSHLDSLFEMLLKREKIIEEAMKNNNKGKSYLDLDDFNF